MDLASAGMTLQEMCRVYCTYEAKHKHDKDANMKLMVKRAKVFEDLYKIIQKDRDLMVSPMISKKLSSMRTDRV